MDDDDDIDWDYTSDGVSGLSLAEIQALVRKGILPLKEVKAAAAREPKLDIKLQGGRLVNAPARPSKRQPHQQVRKVPCEGVTVIGVDPALPAEGKVHPKVKTQLDELTQRQDRLADGVRKALDHTLQRVEELERKPTPFWHLGKWQKSCLILCLIPAGFFVFLYALALIGHLLPLLR